MGKVNEYVGVKVALGSTTLIVGMLALTLAIFSCSQTTQHFFGSYIWYICLLGGLGAIINGSLVLKESLVKRKI